MKHLTLIILSLFWAQASFATSLAPTYETVDALVKVNFVKEHGYTCLAIGCPPAPVFLAAELEVLDETSTVGVIKTQLKQKLNGMPIMAPNFKLGGLLIREGDILEISALVQTYGFTNAGKTVGELEKVYSISHHDMTAKFINFNKPSLITCEDLDIAEQSYAIIANGTNSQVWMKQSDANFLSPSLGKVTIKNLRNGSTQIALQGEEEIVDWSKESRCWKMSKNSNLTFMFKSNGDTEVFKTPNLLVNPAVLCSIPRFMLAPASAIECVQK